MLTACFAHLRETFPFEAIAFAVFKTSSISDSAGQTLFANPILYASSALIIFPVNIISLAMFFPITLGSRCVPPKPGIIPRVISGRPNMAFSEA